MRKLRENSSETVSARPVSNGNGSITKDDFVPGFNFDLRTLDTWKPFHNNEPLPQPVFKINKNGTRYVAQHAEPRFFFNGNELLKVQVGLSGKKTSLHWSYKGDHNKPYETETHKDIRPLHRAIRMRLRQNGIPGA